MADVILTGDGQATRHFTITADHDITGKVAQVSFSSPGSGAPDAPFHVADPVSLVQAGGSWVLTSSILLGPDGVVLEPGDYKVFGQLIDTPERPIESMGYLRVH